MPRLLLLQTGNAALISLCICATSWSIGMMIHPMMFANRTDHGDVMGLIARDKIRIVQVLNVFCRPITGNNTGEDMINSITKSTMHKSGS